MALAGIAALEATATVTSAVLALAAIVIADPEATEIAMSVALAAIAAPVAIA